MSIEAPQGILNIPNATLRVGKLAVNEVVGADTILNTVARNTILLVDGDTYHENKNWDLKLPNAWAGEFECNTASAGNYSEFNFYNEGATSNVQGYNLTFNDTAVQLRYDGTLLTSGTLASTVTGTGVKKVRLLFERTILSVTVDGTLIFTHNDTGGPRPRVYSTTAGGFLNFFTDGGALKNLKIVNEKWISDGTSNIAYVGGNVTLGAALDVVGNVAVDTNTLFVDSVGNKVGIGTTNPDKLLEISGASGLDNSSPVHFRITNTQSATNASPFTDITKPSGLISFYTPDTSTAGPGDVAGIGFRPVSTLGGDTALCFYTNSEDDDAGTPLQERMCITHDGNVGIGTTNPGYKLHVEDLTNPRIMLENTDTLLDLNQDIGSIIFKQNDSTVGTGTGIIGKIRMSSVIAPPSGTFYGESANMIFSVGNYANNNANIDALTIRGNGNVGIGTATPNQRFVVAKLDNEKTTPVMELMVSTAFDNPSPNPSLYRLLDFSTFSGGGKRHCSINLLNYNTSGSGQYDTVGRLKTGLGFSVRNGSSNIENALSINYLGRVGIGTASPGAKFQITQGGTGLTDGIRLVGDGGRTWNIYNDVSGHLSIRGPSFNGGYISEDSDVAQITFTGQHRNFIDGIPAANYTDFEGLVVSANKNKYYDVDENVMTGVNAIQISQSLPLVSLSTTEKDKACFGVISGVEDPESREYKQGSFVSVIQKQKGDRRAFINSVGEGAIWVTNINGSLESGDYITTSNVAGYGQKQDSEFLANYTVAKITMDCDFEPVTQSVQIIRKEMGDVNYWVKTTYENVSEEEYSNLADESRRIVDDIYQEIIKEVSKTEQEGYTPEVRQELVNVLDEHGQIQWEDDPSGATEKAYKIRYLDADGVETDEVSAVHKAAFVGCTYHCG